mmetsp:Transcript_31526/g.86827  ORF Transcript_31526/g.86827 Transcript_31526/m.86827 type:complete len:214 (-) Transcript_31526:129-770(-)
MTHRTGVITDAAQAASGSSGTRTAARTIGLTTLRCTIATTTSPITTGTTTTAGLTAGRPTTSGAIMTGARDTASPPTPRSCPAITTVPLAGRTIGRRPPTRSSNRNSNRSGPHRQRRRRRGRRRGRRRRRRRLQVPAALAFLARGRPRRPKLRRTPRAWRRPDRRRVHHARPPRQQGQEAVDLGSVRQAVAAEAATAAPEEGGAFERKHIDMG